MTTTDTEQGYNQPAQFRHVVAASRKRLFAVFEDPDKGLAAVAEVPAKELIRGEQIWLFHGEEGRRRLDATGAGHGAYGRVVRIFQRAMSDDNQYMDALDLALAAGALVVALPVHDIHVADRVAAVLERHEARNLAFTSHLDFIPTAGEI
jgi:hypothetical protein